MSFKSDGRTYVAPRSRAMEWFFGVSTACGLVCVGLVCFQLLQSSDLFVLDLPRLFLWNIATIAMMALCAIVISPALGGLYLVGLIAIIGANVVALKYLRGLKLRAAIFVLTFAWLFLGSMSLSQSWSEGIA